MAEPTTTPEPTTQPELTVESIVALEPDKLNDEQKAFLQDNAGELDEEQKTKYGIEEKPETVDPEKVEIKTRTKVEEEKKEPEEEEEEEVDPADKKTIGKVVDDKLTNFRGKLDEVQKIKDQQEVDGYVADNPDFKPYRGVMLKYLAHPAYKNIPVENIAAIVAAADLQKLGAKKEREAQKKVKETQGGGNTIRKSSGGDKDWLTASKEDFEAQKNKVLGIR